MIKLEAGKFYRTRDGRKVGPMKACGTSGVLFTSEEVMWYSDGVFYPNMPSKYDIVAEWIDNSHIERTKRMIEVMQAYVDGGGIQRTYNGLHFDDVAEPNWCWGSYDYRIAEAKTPDSINWDHVAPEFICHARDEDGTVGFYTHRPVIVDDQWCLETGEYAEANTHASYCRGTVDWKDSLVVRPGVED